MMREGHNFVLFSDLRLGYALGLNLTNNVSTSVNCNDGSQQRRKQHLPLISVIVIGRKESDFTEIDLHLSRQNYKNFEVIKETGGTIPQAWNQAVKKAVGEYLVFTETDARPLSEYWLDELVKLIDDENAVVKGMEVVRTPWNLCNTLVKRSVFEHASFNENYLWAEDTEFFSHIKSLGFKMAKKESAFLLHSYDPTTRKALGRAFRYGIYWMRIRLDYQDPIEKASITRLFLAASISTLQAFGMLYGWILYKLFKHKAIHKHQQESLLHPEDLNTITECERNVTSQQSTSSVPSHSITGSLELDNQTQQIRLLYVSPLPPVRSGIAKYGYDFSMALEQFSANLEIYRFPIIGQQTSHQRDLLDARERYEQIVQEWRPDIVHFELGYGIYREFFLYYFLPETKNYRVVLTVHDPPALVGEPLHVLQNILINEEVAILASELWRRDHSFFIEKWAYHQADAVISLSEQGIARIREQFGPRNHLFMLPHGIDIPKLNKSSHKDRRSSLGRLLYFGYLHPDKGVETLIKAVQQLEEGTYHLTIAGEAYKVNDEGALQNERYRQDLIKQANSSTHRNMIQFLDFVSDEEVSVLFQQSDMLILPYRKSSVLSASGVLVQGMSYGLPIITTDVRAITEYVQHGSTAWLVPPDSPNELAVAIQRLWENPDIMDRIGLAAYNKCIQRFNWTKVASQAVDVYLQLLKLRQ